jgi:hypothetical protein
MRLSAAALWLNLSVIGLKETHAMRLYMKDEKETHAIAPRLTIISAYCCLPPA